MATKHPQREATRKQNAPHRDAPPSHTTKKVPKAEIEALLKAERERSGTRPAISDEVIETFERSERRSAPTIPAPAEVDFELDLSPGVDSSRSEDLDSLEPRDDKH